MNPEPSGTLSIYFCGTEPCAPGHAFGPRPIAEQMKNAAKLAEADRGSEAPAPQRRQLDRGDR